jgi:hypothetical protein
MDEVEAVKHLTEEQLISHYYGELDNQREAVKHLESCEACRARFAALDSALSLMKTATIPDRPDDYGRRIWQKLQPRLEDKPVRTGPSWFSFPQWKLAAAAVLLVVAGFVAGRFGPGRETLLPEPVSEAARGRILMATVADHLDQSQRALLELANESDAGAQNSSGDQTRAGELVAANRLYRQSAAQAGEASLASVLDELERVLIEIANRPPDVTRGEVREIRRRIANEDLLFKIRVLSSQVRSRETKNSSKSLL